MTAMAGIMTTDTGINFRTAEFRGFHTLLDFRIQVNRGLSPTGKPHRRTKGFGPAVKTHGVHWNIDGGNAPDRKPDSSFAKIFLQQLGEAQRRQNGDDPAFHLDERLVTKLGERT